MSRCGSVLLPTRPRPLGPIRAWPRVIAAAPDYLKRWGKPQTPADLSAHSIIVGPATTIPTRFFQRAETTTSVRVEGRARIAGNEGAIAAAVAGLWIVVTSSGLLRRELEEGTGSRVLED
jgi:DNA-binding transcriptional LysR family regulator